MWCKGLSLTCTPGLWGWGSGGARDDDGGWSMNGMEGSTMPTAKQFLVCVGSLFGASIAKSACVPLEVRCSPCVFPLACEARDVKHGTEPVHEHQLSASSTWLVRGYSQTKQQVPTPSYWRAVCQSKSLPRCASFPMKTDVMSYAESDERQVDETRQNTG